MDREGPRIPNRRPPSYSLPVRVSMAFVGVTLLVFYAALAFVSYALIRWFVRGLTGADLVQTTLVVALLTLGFGYLSYQFGTAELLYGLDATEIPRDRAPELYRRLDDLAAEVGVETPAVAVARMEMPNALAIGSRRGTVVLDGRLFRLLDGPELEGILAHELAHLASRDSLVQTLAYSFVRTMVGVFLLFFLPLTLSLRGLSRGWAWVRGRPTVRTGPGDRIRIAVSHLVVGVFVVLTVLVRTHSRRREFAADERAARITGRPVALARALRKIERASRPAGGLLATLYIHAEEEDPLSRLLSTHPPMDERVERLLEMDAASKGVSPGVRIPVRSG